MENNPTRKKKKIKLVWKIAAAVFLLILLAAGTLFTLGYLYYGKLVKSYLVEFVNRESRGIYSADIGYLYIDVLTGNLTLRNVSLIPDTARYRKMMTTDTLPPLLFKLKIKFFKIKDFRLMEAVRERKIDIEDIQILLPEITLFRMQQRAPQEKQNEENERILSIPLPKGLVSIDIREILFKKGTIDFYDLTGDTAIHQSIPSCTISIKNILVDSVHQGKKRLFNADDISVVINGLSFRTKNGLNQVSLGEIGVSTSRKMAWVKDFHLIPQYSRHDYTRKLGFQTDRLDILAPLVRLNRLDLRQLIFEGKIMAGLLEIEGLALDDYRDKRVPRKPGFRPPMPQDGLRKMKNYLKIDTVLLKNGKATYSEQVGPEPGTISFSNMNGLLTGLTNDSVLLNAGLISELRGSALMMGKGRLDLDLKFRFGDRRNFFTFSAALGPMDLRAVNPMLTKLLPAEIVSGNNRSVTVPLVVANDDEAKGKLIFCYTGLKVAVHSKEKSTWNSIKTGLINWVANDFVVNDQNPTQNGKLSTGVIFFRRDKEKGIINFVWKSVLSGLKSQMGFNSAEQKEMKKTAKKEMKKHK